LKTSEDLLNKEVFMAGGYMGKIGFVDVGTGEIRTQKIDESMVRDFIGGYGIGVRILFEHQKKGADPLGPENILGFTPGTFYARNFNRHKNTRHRTLYGDL
jgi:aldehyde:ferredoxin oxidoreductase